MIYQIPKLNESLDEFITRLIQHKSEYMMTWQDIADNVNDEYNFKRSEKYYRHRSKTILKSDETYEEFIQEKKDKVKITDILTQTNAYIRRISREDTLKEIAADAVDKIKDKTLLNSEIAVLPESENEAILQISDWHYGIDIDHFLNKYNPDIAKKRIELLRDSVISECRQFKVNRLYIANLSDLIEGRIHLKLRLQSRFDVITQTIHVAEMLAEFIAAIANEGITIEYYDCSDNHSRIEPKLKDSLELESMTRIISWYLDLRFKGAKNIYINTKNKYGDDILTFTCKGHSIAGVHGDKDSQSSVISSLQAFTHEQFDLILTAHLHHISADESTRTRLIANGSLMGTDYYSASLRKDSMPSQNLIIVNDSRIPRALIPIDLPIFS